MLYYDKPTRSQIEQSPVPESSDCRIGVVGTGQGRRKLSASQGSGPWQMMGSLETHWQPLQPPHKTGWLYALGRRLRVAGEGQLLGGQIRILISNSGRGTLLDTEAGGCVAAARQETRGSGVGSRRGRE